jgi:hypothetical protein
MGNPVIIAPPPDYRLRLGTLFWCGITFFWMSVEDTSAVTVAILGSGLAVFLMLWWLGQQYGGQRFSLRLGLLVLMLSGAIVGGGAVVLITFLMFFKTAWHAHLFPDYPIEMMLAMLMRLPVWGIAGALLGLGVGLLVSIQRE